ncbi:MAG: ferredoxin--NADP reductase [Burkholderiales bacterium]|jgi:ferredoxin--NADP+ reductase|nr:ferredoxin--NADP reductase [Burkholderiales bacterium]
MMNEVLPYGWQRGRVVARHDWNDRLFSLKIEAKLHFNAGQFVSIGLPATQENHGSESVVARAYSFVNPPHHTPHEFLIANVEGGLLSPRLAQLNEGDTVWLSAPAGFLNGDDIPAKTVLWMLATGTGIAPYISLLNTDTVWNKFKRIVLIRGIRHLEDAVYQDRVERLQERYPDRLTFIECVTRLKDDEGLNNNPYHHRIYGRLTSALETGALEACAGDALAPETSHVMLCGSPVMIDEVLGLLKLRGMQRHRLSRPGHITLERYG